MRITIASRVKPFSHLPGTSLLLPGAGISLRVFPAKVCFGACGELNLGIQGPVADFTVMQDLERGDIKVWGHAANGYFRYRLVATEAGEVVLITEKVPEGGLEVKSDGASISLVARQSLSIGSSASNDAILFAPIDNERLSLGNHKAQLWEQVKSRLDLNEIFPVWFRLGRLLHTSQELQGSGTTQLLQRCQEVAKSGPRDTIFPAFQDLFKAAFSGILHPRLQDTDFQGYDIESPLATEDPLVLLTVGAQVIRSLFVQQHDRQVHLLPNLPSECHCGRFLNVSCGAAATLDFEWSKHTIRRAIFRCSESGSSLFRFQSSVKQFRFRYDENDHGRKIDCDGKGVAIEVLAGRSYLFDNFV